MGVKWEWKLKDPVGPERWKKFDKAIPEEASTSSALAFQWIKKNLQSPTRESDFGPDVLRMVKPSADAIKTKGYPASEPAAHLNALSDHLGLKFTAGDRGKYVAKGGELAAAIKGLDKGTFSLIYLWGAKNKVWHILPIDREKGVKRIFDPFQGQFVSNESQEVADELLKTYHPVFFEGFVILNAESVSQAETRTFEQRLTDFDPDLREFLKQVWEKRSTVSLTDFKAGKKTIYELYSKGEDAEETKPYDATKLKSWLDAFGTICGKYTCDVQGGVQGLFPLLTGTIETTGEDLWHAFFHVRAQPRAGKTAVARVYAHAATPDAGLEIMKAIIAEFKNLKTIYTAKTCGPGSVRKDTIVCYFGDTKGQQALVEVLKKLQETRKELFTDTLPQLVKREAPGIGTAGEPPAIEIESRTGPKKGARHSFGSFFAKLCWLALKETPNSEKDSKVAPDGRHMLDNMLVSLRLLGVDPANPQAFPEKEKLEAWYQAHKAKMS
jgi:hypothetical protein